MSQRKNDLSENIYMSFYRPKIGADGIWELPLVLETVSEANGTTIPLPLPYRKLNAEVLEYLEDVAQQMPKGEEARIVVYLPMEQIQPGLEQKLNKVIDIYGDVRLARLKREEKRALRAALSALAWGFAFMLVCQIFGVFADFPEHPTLTNTISEGFLVLGWVALWKYHTAPWIGFPVRNVAVRLASVGAEKKASRVLGDDAGGVAAVASDTQEPINARRLLKADGRKTC